MDILGWNEFHYFKHSRWDIYVSLDSLTYGYQPALEYTSYFYTIHYNFKINCKGNLNYRFNILYYSIYFFKFCFHPLSVGGNSFRHFLTNYTKYAYTDTRQRSAIESDTRRKKCQISLLTLHLRSFGTKVLTIIEILSQKFRWQKLGTENSMANIFLRNVSFV